MARGLAVLRIFFGIILFANGLAKLLSFSSFTIGPYSANLVNPPITPARSWPPTAASAPRCRS